MFLLFPILPLLALLLFAIFSWRIALPLYLLVLASSFYFTWRSIRAQRKIRPVIGRKAMIGDRAFVTRVGNDDAEVEYKGETWKAVSNQQLHPGQEIMIVKVEGLVLHVAPLSEGNELRIEKNK